MKETIITGLTAKDDTLLKTHSHGDALGNLCVAETTAFGKTVIAAYLIGQRKVNTLILVHTQALLNQWKRALSEFLEINETLPELPKKRGRRKERSLIGQL